MAGAAKFGGGAQADDPAPRRSIAVGGYTLTGVVGAVRERCARYTFS